MYQYIEGNCVISVNDWLAAGLTYAQYNHDAKGGMLSIYRRSTNGNTLIDVKSIRRPERMAALVAAYGPVEGERGLYEVRVDTEARAYYLGWRKEDGSPLEARLIEQYTNRASLLGVLQEGLEKQKRARAHTGMKVKMKEWYAGAMAWYNEQQVRYPSGGAVTNVRSFERIFKAYCEEGYGSCVSGRLGNDSARKVSVRTENLLLALWRRNDKPFVARVWVLYNEFVNGERELWDEETGELFRPEEFRYKGRPVEISEATVWQYLKGVVNQTAVYKDRNGSFEYQNRMRPKHVRRLGAYSLSKVSMDDVALSRQSVKGWVYKYIAVDVLSGYYFRPAYVVGKPDRGTVEESFRNMFCELEGMGLPMPGELEVEHHLMEHVEWLERVFPFVRFCASATEKRAEHNIKALKYGAAKDAGHTLGRWYAKGEAYRSVRNKVEGDYVQAGSGKGVGGLRPETIIADDLADIEAHNNGLHPNQKRFPGMTRRDVLMERVNPELKGVERWYLWRFIGHRTATSVVNNNRVMIQGEHFELESFEALSRMKANSRKVEAYWVEAPQRSEGGEGSRIEEAYLYQGDRYIGRVENMERQRYNEFACERTEEDEAAMLHQQKRVAKFDKMVRERRASVPRVGVAPQPPKGGAGWHYEEVEAEVVEVHEQPKNYEGDENEVDYAALALESL